MKKNLYRAVQELASTLGCGSYEKTVDTDKGIYNVSIKVYEDYSFAYAATPAIVEA